MIMNRNGRYLPKTVHDHGLSRAGAGNCPEARLSGGLEQPPQTTRRRMNM